jgi:deoxyribonuclease (pyrimidine dimer)
MDQHLMAEYCEIRMLCANLQRTLKSKVGFQESKVPNKFTLNSGHVYFFYNKGEYIHKRYGLLRQELKKRGMSADLEFPTHVWPDHLYNDWTPTEADKNVVRERISSRIARKPGWYRYYGKTQKKS